MPLRRCSYTILALVLAVTGLPAATAGADGLDLDQYRGKVVVVDFWASWCVPCRRSFPWMNSMHAKYRDQGLVVIGVNVDRDRADAERFLADVPASFRIHFDEGAGTAEAFGVEAMPSSYVIGRDGEIVARHLGFKVKRQDEYEAVLVEALGDTP